MIYSVLTSSQRVTDGDEFLPIHTRDIRLRR